MAAQNWQLLRELGESISDAFVGMLQELDAQVQEGGGGSGSIEHTVFPFAFDTPNLTTGVEVYTPQAGEWLMDAWFENDTVGGWSGGFTPLADIYTDAFLSAQEVGLWAFSGVSIALNQGDDFASGDIRIPAARRLSVIGNGSPIFYYYQYLAADPVKLCVSQDGLPTGDPDGSTDGSAKLHLLTLAAT